MDAMRHTSVGFIGLNANPGEESKHTEQAAVHEAIEFGDSLSDN